MEQHGPGGVKYLHDLTATHVDADHMWKVLLFLPRLPQHIPIRQRPSSTTRSSLNPSSLPQAQPRPSGSGARRTSAHSTTGISTHRPSRSRRSLELTFYRLTCCSFPYMLARLTSTKRSFLTKTDRTRYGRRAKSSRSHHWRRVVEDRLLNVVHHQLHARYLVCVLFSNLTLFCPYRSAGVWTGMCFLASFKLLVTMHMREHAITSAQTHAVSRGKYVNMYNFFQREKGQ